MNFRLLSRLLGIVALLIGAMMLFSMPWAFPALGYRNAPAIPKPEHIEWSGLTALLVSMLVSFAVGGALIWLGRRTKGQLFRKEAMAVVGLSWILATVLGALPFHFAGVQRTCSVRLNGMTEGIQVFHFDGFGWHHWDSKRPLKAQLYEMIEIMNSMGAKGVDAEEFQQELARYDLMEIVVGSYDEAQREGLPDDSLEEVLLERVHGKSGQRLERETVAQILKQVGIRADDHKNISVYQTIVDLLFKTDGFEISDDEFEGRKHELEELCENDEQWRSAIIFPDEEEAPNDREDHYRIRWIKMGIADCLFESQSGFSTTGATVISDLEDPVLIPHCILFWRSMTHFLGGLGIIVLFVVLLGQGSAGKALMRAEMPGPTKEGSTARMQDTAWRFAAMYCGLNLILVFLLLPKMTLFDAICHAFGTMATGGFSTYNKSIGAFDSAYIDYIITLFMILAGTNFTLLYLLLLRKPKALWVDVEWRTYMSVIFGITALVMIFGLWNHNFPNFFSALRYGLFQVVSIITTTGYGTNDFDSWNSFGRGVLFLLMFVGGCAGSTGGGMKVIRHILFLKIMRLEIEQAYHPRVVRPLWLGGRPADDPNLRKNILVYFGLILVIFVFSWLFVITVEPDSTWGTTSEHKLIDSATGVAATLNNIGPGLGTVGATQNYGHFTPLSKFLYVWLMMIGRLEIFSILVLFVPSFWRNY
jgi:trk system potassium uptake protein TrkH